MIDRIYIPTVNRVNNQITFNNLPVNLQKKVILVVQEWERDQYQYDCEYLVLPPEINVKTEYLALAKTRKIIIQHGRNHKFAMLDDDLLFYRRNSKYWSDDSNMEKSKKRFTNQDFSDMLKYFCESLDTGDIAVCGCSNINNFPAKKQKSINTVIAAAFFINGPKIDRIIDDLHIDKVKIGEDVLFNLNLLTKGYGNLLSNEFCLLSDSDKKTVKSDIWDNQLQEDTLRDYKMIESLYGDFFMVHNNKYKMAMKKAYLYGQNSLKEFMYG